MSRSNAALACTAKANRCLALLYRNEYAVREVKTIERQRRTVLFANAGPRSAALTMALKS
jgi:hypothetical protein